MDTNKNQTDEVKKDNESVQLSVETNNNFETSKETSSSGGGDVDSMQSDGAKTLESRDDRIKRLKEQSEVERQRKYTEIIESQRQSSELRQRQQDDRRKKIEELKQREEERKKKVEQRRQEMDAKEKEKNESLLRRTKEREARAAIIQKQIRMTASMTQSMTSSNQNRMTTSIHSGASSGSEKCTAVYNRSLSSAGCDIDRHSSNVLPAAGANITRKATKRPQIPPGFIEIDGGQIIPANTRHAGCFVPFKGSHHRVKGVLAWGPPTDRRVHECGSSVSWWAGIDEQSAGGKHNHHHHQQPQQQHHTRATSAHASLIGTRGYTHKESTVPPRVRSSSRTRTAETASIRVPRQPAPKIVSTTPLGDNTLFVRLSKPRSGSQPPKNPTKETLDTPPKNMSASFTRQPTKITPRTVAATTKQPVPISAAITDKKKPTQKRKSLPLSAPDSGLTSSPASEMEPTQAPLVTKDNEDVTETTRPEEVPTTKTRPKKTDKNSPKKEEIEINVVNESVTETKPSPVTNEEETYRLKLTEQRRMAREAKERQQEEQRKLEEEAKQKALEEKKRSEDETRKVIEEEAIRVKQLEEEEEVALEKQRIEEETERIKREEMERELEEKRVEKSRLDDSDRMERKRRLEKIMSRVKKADDSSSLSNEESAAVISESMEPVIVVEESHDKLVEISLENGEKREEMEIVNEDLPSEPMVAWTKDIEVRKEDVAESEENVVIEGDDDQVNNTASPSLISDDVLNLPGPEANISCVSQSQVTSVADSLAPSNTDPAQPQFKSRLLQSMMAKGRLTTSSSDVRLNSITNTSDSSRLDNKRKSLILSQINGDVDTAEFMSHSRSYTEDISKMSTSMIECDQSRNGLSYELAMDGSHLSNGGSHHCDIENDVTMSSIISNLDGSHLSINDNNDDNDMIETICADDMDNDNNEHHGLVLADHPSSITTTTTTSHNHLTLHSS